MDRWISIITKFIFIFFAGYLTFNLMDGLFIGIIALIAVVAAVATYFIGDLAILPSYGNVLTSVANGLIAAVLAYITILLWPGISASLTSLAFFAIVVAIAEYLFHLYLESQETVTPDAD